MEAYSKLAADYEKKFYVASSFANIDSVRYVSESLKNKGYLQTYDWTANERATSLGQLMEIGKKEKAAVLESDFVIILLPAGKGSHIEMGIALGQGKRVFLYSSNNDVNKFELTSTFYHLPEVKQYIGPIEQFVDFCIEEMKK
nr:group-specific protein [Fredinandcohnia sp. SECRCQ15]